MTPHTAHLTLLARIALHMPGTWAWTLVVRKGLATRPCRNRKHQGVQR